MPKTDLGKWSVGLIVVFFLLFAAFRILVVSGQRGGETFFSNPILAILGMLIKTGGLAIIILDFTNQRVKNLAREILREHIS